MPSTATEWQPTAGRPSCGYTRAMCREPLVAGAPFARTNRSAMVPEGGSYLRALLAAAFAFYAVVLVVVQAMSIPAAGELPTFSIRALDSNRRLVTSVTPEAATGGLRPGDVYDWSRATDQQRRARFHDTAAGDALTLPVIRGSNVVPVRVIAHPRNARDQLASYADVLLKLLGMGTGILLIARGKSRFGLLSGIGLFAIAGAEGFNVSYAVLGFPFEGAADSFNRILCSGLLRYSLVAAMIALCTGLLTRPEVWFFRIIGVVTVAGVVAVALDEGIASVALTPPHIDPRTSLWAQLLFRVELLGYGIALLRSAASERPLLTWVFWSSVVGFAGPTINFLLLVSGKAVPAYGALNLTFFAMAFGFAYVALRYRVVDLSFVVNRALAYAVILTIVVGALSISEALITKLALGKTDSLAIEVALALALGFSIKHIERRVDRIVERTLFARKHAQEEGLRQLIRDCAHVEDPDRLVAHVCEETRRLTDAAHVTIYQRIGDWLTPVAASPQSASAMPVNLDDSVVIRMRSVVAPVVLGSMRSTFGSEGTVFPMLARGQVMGAIACGSKPGRRSYDPDERAVLTHLAHEAGNSLLLLQSATFLSTFTRDGSSSARNGSDGS